MIRMRAKSVLLSIMLVLASCVFFACKEPVKINVESIGFTEQRISMLIGDEYTPEIKVLPSYATIRSYSLISSDTTALKIEGGTITALRPAMDIKLKVVSDDNVNINDVVTVDIYSEATQLDAPTELRFDGDRFVFVGKDNANAYMMNVNGIEIPIGNNTEYRFSDIVGKIDNAYNTVINCSVKSLGDGNVFVDSEYGETISFVKLSAVENVLIENETLKFDAIENVASYTVSAVNGTYSQLVENLSFAETQLSLDISSLVDSIAGAEYLLQIVPNIEGCNVPSDVDVYISGVATIDYAVVGRVENLSIIEKVLSWGFVDNAQNYTVQIFKDDELIDQFENILSNELRLTYDEGGNYSCKVIANSSASNVTTGKEYSLPLDFKILYAPEITATNNTVSWTDTEGADGYLVTLKDGAGEFITNQKFVITNTYDVSKFAPGTYYIEVMACGNGENSVDTLATMSSVISEGLNWIILDGVEVEVKDEKLYWKDEDVNSLHKYHVIFDDVDVTLTENDYSEEYSYNEENNLYCYDLSSHYFEPGSYTVTVQSIGENATFDAVVKDLEIIKLPETVISGLANKKFTIIPVDNADSYKIEIYKADDLINPILTLDEMKANSFELDTTIIDAGNYVAKVFVFGNGVEVFDAEDPTSELSFEKLAIPTIEIDAENFKAIVDVDDLIQSEVSYKLFENGMDLGAKLVDNQYDLSQLTAGVYVYTAQAIGDNATVLDSEITVEENSKQVKKISTPTITFDKETLTFEVSCGSDEDFVGGYTFTLDDKLINVVDNLIQCSPQDDIVEAKNYRADVYANPCEVEGYDLVIGSETETYSFVKLQGLCGFNISNNVLEIMPDKGLVGTGYSLIVRIENGDNDIVLEGFDYSNSKFSLRLQDLEYNAIEELASIMQDVGGEFSLYTTISQNEENVITSDTVECERKLKVLEEVTDISKNQQTIEFVPVDDAVNYIIVIEVDGKEYYIDIAQIEGILEMEALLALFETAEVPYLEQVPYYLSFISITNDRYTLSNKGATKYTFEFLKTPTVSIIEEENNVKKLSIANDDINASIYSVFISQNDVGIGEDIITKTANLSEILDIYEMTKDEETLEQRLVAGDVRILVQSFANSGDYFDSRVCQLDIVKLDTPIISVVDGMLVWDQIDNAKQYNLTYSNIYGTNVEVLAEGVENFTIENGKCVYDFVKLIPGNTSLYLQVDANLQKDDTYYLNSYTGEMFDVYKMDKPSISVVNGRVYVEMPYSDLVLSKKVDIRVDGEAGVEIYIEGEASEGVEGEPSEGETGEGVEGEPVEGGEISIENIKVVYNGNNIASSKDGRVQIELIANNVGITIDPNILCRYGDAEIIMETLTIKAYSKHQTTLNSPINSKEVYGLLRPFNLDITTSINVIENGIIDEIFEKIKWRNPVGNGELVAQYEITINYKNVNYKFYTDTCSFMMPKYCDYDVNNNGRLDYSEDLNKNGQLDEGEDINGNGILDRVESLFGSGDYNIKVRALISNSEKYVISGYSEEIKVVVLPIPTKLSVQDGNVSWINNVSGGYYIVKIYFFGKDAEGNVTKDLILSTQTNVSQIDLTQLNPFETGVYGVSVQAMHDSSRILASEESDVLEVIRLPQVTEYYVKDGELYFRVHKFFAKAEIYLTDKETGTITTKLPNLYGNCVENINKYSMETGYKKWSESNIIETYTDEDYFIDVKYVAQKDSTLTQIISGNYSIAVKLLGSDSFTSTNLNLSNLGGQVSGYISYPINRYLDNDGVEDKNFIEKLITPTSSVSETERGVICVGLLKESDYSLRYYIDGENSLQGVHLYTVKISTDKEHTLYIANIINAELFQSSLDAVGSAVIQDNADKNNLKHFEYNGITFNIIDPNEDGTISFDFSNSYYYYYEPKDEATGNPGGYCSIELSKGGSFVLNVRFMGDDTIFVNSNVTKDVAIKRYSVLNLSIQNGVMSWSNQATVDDHPIYLITLSGNNNESYNLVLYNPDVEYEPGQKYNEEYLLNCLDSSKNYIFDTITYVVTESIKDEIIVYRGLADIIDRIRVANGMAPGLGGDFIVTIKVHYTSTASTDIVLAQDAESKNILIIPQAEIGVEKGALTWELVSITNSGGIEHIYNYELQVIDSTGETYEIILDSSMYNLVNSTATYHLPQILVNGDAKEFKFVADSNYTFKLKALGGDSGLYINSVATTTDEIHLLPQLEDVRMEGGVLRWTNTLSNSVEIQVSYEIDDGTIVYTTVVSQNSFTLPVSFDDDTGTTRYFVSGKDYYIRARLKGGNDTLNGFYNDEIDGEVDDTKKVVTTRLETINKNTIVTNVANKNGVLTWTANELEGITYSVVYTLEDGTTHTKEMLDLAEFDFEGVPAGIIKLKVLAHHDLHFTSFASDTNEFGNSIEDNLVEVFKLSTISLDTLKKEETTNIISWGKIKDATGNAYVDNYKVSIRQEGVEDVEYECESNEWLISGIVGTAFEIAIKAIALQSNNENVINSDYTVYYPIEIPSQVDVETFEFDEDEQAFKWKAIDGEVYEQTSNRYYIGYNYYENGQNSVSEEEVTIKREINGEVYYYYYPSKIGTYSSIYVQVKRAGSLSSQKTYCINKADGTQYMKNFALFASGCGTDINPYIIKNATHLYNIKYFLNAYYELANNIPLGTYTSITKSTQVFSGSIDGKGYEIIGGNSTDTLFNDSGYNGLFELVRGAIFKNITLTGFNVEGVVNAAESYIGILAGKVEAKQVAGQPKKQSIFQNITITSSTIKITKNTSSGYTNIYSETYVGAIVGYAIDAIFESCIISLGDAGSGESDLTKTVNITAIIEGGSNTILAVGGVAGYANNCEFNNNSSKGGDAYRISVRLSTAEGSSGSPTIYVGALLGVQDSAVNIGDTNTCLAKRIINATNYNEIALVGEKF